VVLKVNQQDTIQNRSGNCSLRKSRRVKRHAGEKKRPWFYQFGRHYPKGRRLSKRTMNPRSKENCLWVSKPQMFHTQPRRCRAFSCKKCIFMDENMACPKIKLLKKGSSTNSLGTHERTAKFVSKRGVKHRVDELTRSVTSSTLTTTTERKSTKGGRDENQKESGTKSCAPVR